MIFSSLVLQLLAAVLLVLDAVRVAKVGYHEVLPKSSPMAANHCSSCPCDNDQELTACRASQHARIAVRPALDAQGVVFAGLSHMTHAIPA